MGAICVDFDLYGYGQLKAEVGEHAVARAHVFQAACGLRLLEWMLKNRNDVDTTRIGICGGSGGGTHTILLSLLAESFDMAHIAAIAPVVHVASHFDGGCPCESGMPVQLSCGGTCEPELAATFAPRPMLVVSDGGDWTSTVPTLEYPYLQRMYGFYQATNLVKNVHLPDERHDFGPSKRQAVYQFFAEVFDLDITKADESKVTIQPEDNLKTQLP
jgi:poly(3-hydroxybutyrate) depolymerase